MSPVKWNAFDSACPSLDGKVENRLTIFWLAFLPVPALLIFKPLTEASCRRPMPDILRPMLDTVPLTPLPTWWPRSSTSFVRTMYCDAKRKC